METTKPISACNGGAKTTDFTGLFKIYNVSVGPGTLEQIKVTCLLNENVERRPNISGKLPIILK